MELGLRFRRLVFSCDDLDARDVAECAAILLTSPFERHVGKSYNLTGIMKI